MGRSEEAQKGLVYNTRKLKMENWKDDIHSEEENSAEQTWREDQELSLEHVKCEMCIPHMQMSE